MPACSPAVPARCSRKPASAKCSASMAAWLPGRRKVFRSRSKGKTLMSRPRVLMYSTGVCPYCLMAERLLKEKGVDDIEKIRIDLDPSQRSEMMEKTGRRTVPQIYIGDTHVGGFDDLSALNRQGKLDGMLA